MAIFATLATRGLAALLLLAGPVAVSGAQNETPHKAGSVTALSKQTNTAPVYPMLTNAWSVRLDTGSDSTPAVGPDGTVYFGTFNGKLWAVSADGETRWTFSAGREIHSSPAVAPSGAIYFGSRDNKLYAVSALGKKLWDFQTGGWVDSSPALGADGTVYFGSWDKNFYALSAEGSRRWLFGTGGEIVSSPAVGADGTIYFGSHDKKYYALAPDGSKKWEFATGGPIVSSPALDREQVSYITSVDGFFYAINPDGTLRWRARTGGFTDSSPVIAPDGTIYVGVNTNFVALSREGRELGRRPLHDLMEGSGLVFEDNSVAFISRRGLLVGQDAKRDWLWSYYTFGYGYSSPVVGTNGQIYVYGYDEGPAFIALKHEKRLAPGVWPKFRGAAANTGAAK